MRRLSPRPAEGVSTPSYPSPRHIFTTGLSLPGQQAAVVEKGLLDVDAPVLQGGHGAAVVTPPQLHRGIQVGGGALQREAVPAEDQLPLGGDELEEGQLQRSICNKRRGRKRTAGSVWKTSQRKRGGSFFYPGEVNSSIIHAK